MATHPLLKQLQQTPSQPVQHDNWTLEADGAEANSLGLSADALRLRRTTSAEATPSTLARTLAKRATYLLEPLAPIEHDGQKALIRSAYPTDEGEGRDYYELWATPNDLSIERFRGHPDQPREPCPVNLTWEQAERLVRDVDAAYSQSPDE